MHTVAIMLAMMLPAAQPAAEPARPPRDVVVVCPTALRDGLAPWLAHRTAEGYRPVVIASAETADQVRAGIRQAAGDRPLAAIVLVGDAASGPAARTNPEIQVPMGTIEAKVSRRFGGGPIIASDAYLADLDEDGIPDVPIGRLPADNVEDLAQMIQKTIRYEQDANYKTWRRRLQLVAGAGGFGAVADRALEVATQAIITRVIPPAYKVTMTYASPGSPFFPGGDRFRTEAVARHNEGCLFFVYIGHANSQLLDVGPGVRERAVLSTGALGDLAAAEGNPVALLLACSAAEIDAPRDCLAEELFRRPGGPVAVVGGTRVTMPYGMGSLALEMASEQFEQKAATIGESLHRAKRDMLVADRHTAGRMALDLMAKVVSPAPADLPQERLEHAHLMELVGDPLLTIRQPLAVELKSPASATAGGELVVDGSCEIDGRYRVELVAPLGRNEAGVAPGDGEPAELAAYRSANNVVRGSREGDAHDGKFHAVLSVPTEARGGYFVRAYIEAAAGFAMGAAAVQIVAAPTP